jgi:hypothetical protein
MIHAMRRMAEIHAHIGMRNGAVAGRVGIAGLLKVVV